MKIIRKVFVYIKLFIIFDITQTQSIMKFIPNILDTKTKQGDFTLVRKWYLQNQIIELEKQEKKLKKYEPDNLFKRAAVISFLGALKATRQKFSDELFEYFQRQDEYNS